jgi:CelD/BcsL family acetyltransferase involved in cellulose biosynthesis
LPQVIVHRESPVRNFYTVSLPTSFSDYLARFTKKKRYNLNRQVRLLREAGNGDLSLRRIESVDQIPGFIHDARTIAQQSWQHQYRPELFTGINAVESLGDLARRNLLRAYVLICGGAPCAFVLGYQRNQVYHYADIGYDQAYARFSPGAVLYYLMLEDLIAYRRPVVLNLGIGDSEYKRQFATDYYQELTVLLFRPHLKNTVLHLARSVCVFLRSTAKSLLQALQDRRLSRSRS